MSSTLPVKYKPFLLYTNVIEMFKAREKCYVVMDMEVTVKHNVAACPAVINNSEEFIKLMRDYNPMIVAAVEDTSLDSSAPRVIRSRSGEPVKLVNFEEIKNGSSTKSDSKVEPGVGLDGKVGVEPRKKINVEVIVIFDVRDEHEKIGSAVIDHAFSKVKDLFPKGKFIINLKILVSEDIRSAITAKIAALGVSSDHIAKASAVQEVVFKSNKLDSYIAKGIYGILSKDDAKKYLKDMVVDASMLPTIRRGDVMSIWLDANKDDIILYETMTPGGKVVTRTRVEGN